jgi:uncharacterized protein (TIGR03435 family)
MKFSLGISIALCLLAQAQEFEVTSVKVNLSGAPKAYRDPFIFSAGRFSATNVTLADLLLVAYRTTRIQTQGGPSWMDSNRFDINAVGDVKRGQMFAMIQNLLVDRFSLVVHRVTKESPAFVLVVGKAGHKLLAARDDEVSKQMLSVRGVSTFEKLPVASLAMMLSAYLREPVVDKTELKGFFDFTLDLTPEEGSPLTLDTLRDTVLRVVPEQLGLRLEMQKAPIENIVVDRAERPTAN